MPTNGPSNNLVGQIFGDLTVVEYVKGTKKISARWICVCVCGERRINSTNMLNSGRARSCGCTRNLRIGAKKRIHGHSTKAANSRTYRIWANMKTRCDNPKASNYAWYGAIGVRYDPRWASFEAFLADMGACPDGLTLERKNRSGEYSKGNCVWATWTEQNRNRRDTRWLDVRGERISLQAAAERYKVNPGTLWDRLNRGQSAEVALRMPATAAARGVVVYQEDAA